MGFSPSVISGHFAGVVCEEELQDRGERRRVRAWPAPSAAGCLPQTLAPAHTQHRGCPACVWPPYLHRVPVCVGVFCFF